MKQVLATTIILLSIAGCTSETLDQKHYPITVQCSSGCRTLADNEYGYLSRHQRWVVREFSRKHGHGKPILVSPCYRQDAKAWTAVIQGYIEGLGYKARVVRPTQSYRRYRGLCVNLLAGKLHIKPPKCESFKLGDDPHKHTFGCATKKWLAYTVSNPYDFFVLPGVKGQH